MPGVNPPGLSELKATVPDGKDLVPGIGVVDRGRAGRALVERDRARRLQVTVVVVARLVTVRLKSSALILCMPVP